MSLSSITFNSKQLSVPAVLKKQESPAVRSESDAPAQAGNKPKETAAFSSQELNALRQLQSIDKQVRAHEKAHMNAAAGIVRGGASFTMQVGADGKQYAVGGEVSVDTSKVVNDPQATILKARQIQRAAQAPIDPSRQDRAIAANAYAMEQRAVIELRDLKLLEAQLAEAENSSSIDVLV